MPKGVYIRKHIVTEATRLKMSLSMKGKTPKHKVAGWNNGKKGLIKATPERKEIMRKIALEKGFGKWMANKKGAQANNWKGGVSRDRHGTYENKIWRSKIFERDNWTCQTCQARGVYLEAHHIKSWAKFPELRYELENGVTLCQPCHALTDNYRGKNR